MPLSLLFNSHSPLNLDQVGSVSVLLRHGVDAHSEDYDGLKPIDLAKGNKHEECVKILFKALTPTILVTIVIIKVTWVSLHNEVLPCIIHSFHSRLR